MQTWGVIFLVMAIASAAGVINPAATKMLCASVELCKILLIVFVTIAVALFSWSSLWKELQNRKL